MFFSEAAVLIMTAKGYPRTAITERVFVSYEFFPPDNRRRDFDNLLKCLNDSMQKARLIKDDSQIKSGEFYFHAAKKNQNARVRLVVRLHNEHEAQT